MRYLTVKFICQLTTPGIFSAYKGSMLRGALGTNLRRGLCMTRKKDCVSCMLATNCIFPRIFSASAAPAQEGFAPLLPPPFCVEPDIDHKRVYAEGEPFSFSLKLFSFAVEYLPFFVHAFNMAGQHGLGQGNGLGQFRIADILQGEQSIFKADTEQLLPYKPVDLALPKFLHKTGDSLLTLRILTPLRFKTANHLSTALEFSMLLNLIFRRIKSLWALDGFIFHLSQEEFAVLNNVAAKIRIQDNQLCWQDVNRYSGRQQASMKFGGVLGRICYEGPVGAFQEYLDFAVKVHIGKQTSFGLGALDFSI